MCHKSLQFCGCESLCTTTAGVHGALCSFVTQHLPWHPMPHRMQLVGYILLFCSGMADEAVSMRRQAPVPLCGLTCMLQLGTHLAAGARPFVCSAYIRGVLLPGFACLLGLEE